MFSLICLKLSLCHILFFQYLFVDKRHKIVFSTGDDCSTIVQRSVLFSPDEIVFHPSDSEVVLAYDETTTKVTSGFKIKSKLSA